jgi:hypothetical protein
MKSHGLIQGLLRPLLEKHLPHYKGVSAAFVSNFCKHVFAFWGQTGENMELTMEEAKALVSPSRTVADDVIDMDDPII